MSDRRYLVREGPYWWERWDNFSQEWQPMFCQSAREAVRYAAAIYGVRPKDVLIVCNREEEQNEP